MVGRRWKPKYIAKPVDATPGVVELQVRPEAMVVDKPEETLAKSGKKKKRRGTKQDLSTKGIFRSTRVLPY